MPNYTSSNEGTPSTLPIVRNVTQGANNCITLLIWLLKLTLFFSCAIVVLVAGLVIYTLFNEYEQEHKEKDLKFWISIGYLVFAMFITLSITQAICCEKTFCLFILTTILCVYTGFLIYREMESKELHWGAAFKQLHTTEFINLLIYTAICVAYVTLLCIFR